MRDDYITWDEYFMELAKISAKRSKDKDKQVGACIVDINNKVISLGYNGMPYGMADNQFNWNDIVKWQFVVHAELNAILNAKQDLKGCRIYCTLRPCNECAKAIVQSGIDEVIYLEDFKPEAEYMLNASIILKQGRVKVRQFGGIINENKNYYI